MRRLGDQPILGRLDLGRGRGLRLGHHRLVAAQRLLGLGAQRGGPIEIGGDPLLPRLQDLADPRQGLAAEQPVERAEADDQPEDLAREGRGVELRQAAAMLGRVHALLEALRHPGRPPGPGSAVAPSRGGAVRRGLAGDCRRQPAGQSEAVPTSRTESARGDGIGGLS